MCVYLCILVSNTIFISDDVHVTLRRVPLVKQKLLTLSEHPSSLFVFIAETINCSEHPSSLLVFITETINSFGTPEFTLGFYCFIFSFLCRVLQIIVCPFVIFRFTIVLPVLRVCFSINGFRLPFRYLQTFVTLNLL